MTQSEPKFAASGEMAERRQVEQALREQTHTLRQRLKELNCLYGISLLRDKPGVSLAEIYQGTADLIPPAWQYPEVTAARVMVDEQEHRTEIYGEGAAGQQSADIVVHGQVCGRVQVSYVEERPECDEGPFLKQERNLLNAIAERLGRITEYKRAEKEYHTILETAIDGFWLCDTQGHILDVNDALCQMLGYTRDELLALSVQDLEAEESPKEVAQHIKVVIERGYDRFDSRHRAKDGRLIDIEASVSYLEATGGRFFAFIRDITGRKRAEEALLMARDDLEQRVAERTADLNRGHQREQVLNALLRLSMENISLDEQLSRALAEILSIPWLPEQPQGGIFLVGDNPPSGAGKLELRAQRGLKQAQQAACRQISFGQCLCGRAAASQDLLFAEYGDERHEIHYEGMEPHAHYCVPIVCGDRSVGILVLYLEQSYPRDAQYEEFLRAVTDTLAGIIERKRAEEALRQSERRLAWAQRVAHLGNWEWDVETNQLHWSDEIYRIFGLAPQAFGATYEAFLHSVHPGDRSLVECAVDSALYEKQPYSIDHRIVLPDGSVRTVHEQAEVTCARSGQPIRMLGTVQDVTESKRAESALRQSEQRLRHLNEQLESYGRELEQKVAERTREIEQRRQVAESLRGILTVLNSNRDLVEILNYIVTEAGRLLGSGTSAIYRLVVPDAAFKIQTAQGQYAEWVTPLRFPAECHQALLDGQPVAVSDAVVAFPDSVSAGTGEILIPEALARYCPAMLAVPLIVADEVYGGLVLYYAESRVFSGDEVDLAVAFADQAALAIENARLHQYTEEVAVLEERSRLARDLHDSVTQSLYSIVLLAESWKRLSRTGKLEDVEAPLSELGDIAQQALKEMRLMVHELRPPDLEKAGLLGALHQRLAAVEKRAGVEARLLAEDVPYLPQLVEEELYHIALEALNNTLKHATATQVIVYFHQEESRVTLEVVDNGCGFDVNRLDECHGVGLLSMRQRAEKLGGTLTLDSGPGEGTRVRVEVEAHSNPKEL